METSAQIGNQSYYSDFYRYLKIIQKILKRSKNTKQIKSINYYNGTLVSQHDFNQIANMLVIIKLITRNDLDSIFDFYSQLDKENKFGCLEAIIEFSTNPNLVKWMALPEINLTDLKIILVIKKVKLSDIKIINRFCRIFQHYSKKQFLEINSKNVDKINFKNKVIDVKISEQMEAVVRLALGNVDIYDWFLYQEPDDKKNIIKALKILSTNKNKILKKLMIMNF